jgi:hypothetical protein
MSDMYPVNTRSPYLTDLEVALGQRDTLVKALQAAQGQIMNAKIDLQTGHTKAAGIRTLDGIIKFVDDALASIKDERA